MKSVRSSRRGLTMGVAVLASLLGGAGGALLGVCGPFTDVSDAAFCPLVLETFYLGITTGTSPATYSPEDPVTRIQMAAFLSRAVDGTLRRGSRRAALNQFWTPKDVQGFGLTPVGAFPQWVRSDGSDLWVTNGDGLSRVRGSDGKLLETWTGAGAGSVLVAMGRVFVTGGKTLFMIDPAQPAGGVTTVASTLGTSPLDIAFDGSRIWTANGNAGVGSVSIVTPGALLPWTVTTVTTGFGVPRGIVYDGTNVWVSDLTANTLLRLDASAAILQTTTVGGAPGHPVFDGENIWVPNALSFSTSVVRASTGVLVSNLTGNGQNFPFAAAFDGERVLVTSPSGVNGNAVSLWKAADLTPLGFVPTGSDSHPFGACSDGVNFWVALSNKNQLARF